MSFEINKILGAVLFALLIITSLRLIAAGIFQEPSHAPASLTATQTASAPAPTPTLSLPELLAQASVEKGAKVARRCVSCHTFKENGKNRLGPNLWNILNRKVASHEGFNYSSAMKNKGGVWDFEALDAFTEKPRKYVKGTTMGFAGLRKQSQRGDLLLYLRSLSNDPAPLP